MATGANVRSVDALESFRASLIVFATRARQAVDHADEEVARTRQWVLNDRRLHWTEQFRKRTRVLERAEQELFSARLSSLKSSLTMQEQALRKAKLAVEEAESKMRSVKAWSRDFDRVADPLLKKLENVRRFLEQSMPKAVASLEMTQRILESYAAAPPPASGLPVPAEPGNQG